MGRAGRSGGKKKHSIMCRYRWLRLYSTAFQPLIMLSTRLFCTTASTEGASSTQLSPTPITASRASRKKSFQEVFQLPQISRRKK